MQVKLTALQENIQHDWFQDLTTKEILCVVGYYLLGLPARDMAKAMGFEKTPMKIYRIAKRGAAKAHIHIRTDKGKGYGLESDEDDCNIKQKR